MQKSRHSLKGRRAAVVPPCCAAASRQRPRQVRKMRSSILQPLITVADSGSAYSRLRAFDWLFRDLVPQSAATPHSSYAALSGHLCGCVLFPSGYRYGLWFSIKMRAEYVKLRGSAAAHISRPKRFGNGVSVVVASLQEVDPLTADQIHETVFLSDDCAARPRH
jgi:hypothetical protein